MEQTMTRQEEFKAELFDLLRRYKVTMTIENDQKEQKEHTMKTYCIQWTSPNAYGGSCVSAPNARAALKYIRDTIPGVIIDSFSVE